MHRMKILLIALLWFLLEYSFMSPVIAQKSQVIYTDAASLTLAGQVFPIQGTYHRVDTTAFSQLPAAVSKLLTQGAGLAISFKTNSTALRAKWCVTKARQLNNMTAIANKGLDLYIRENGKWQYAGVGRPDSVCSEYEIVRNMDRTEKECLLYLPLYDELKSLLIGIDPGAFIQPMPDPFRKRVVIYGSSIVQGASASRPGMAYPARLSRQTGIHFLNLGLSGSAKMEKSVADLVSTVPADAYILDCVPNSTPEQISKRTAYLVRTIRSKHPHAPIIMVQSIFRESGYFDKSVGDRVRQQNGNYLKEFERLKQEGVKHLYFISAENMLGDDHEGTTDGTHPNDIGFDRMIQVLQPRILEVLKEHRIVL